MKYLVAVDMDISRCVSNSELAADDAAIAQGLKLFPFVTLT